MIVIDLLYYDKFIVINFIDIGVFVTSHFKEYEVSIAFMCADYRVLFMNFVVGFFLYIFLENKTRCRSPPLINLNFKTN